jgi:hypothetical protein
MSMARFCAFSCTLLAVAFLVQGSTPLDGAALQKNQMVKGTIKEVQTDKDVLIVNQKVKNQTVDRELSIEADTEFLVTKAGQTQKGVGSAGLKLLEGAKGANVQVKCDKDVKVLQVKVTIK